jgi:hypothetical protein
MRRTFEGTCKGCSVHIQGTFREHSGNMPPELLLLPLLDAPQLNVCTVGNVQGPFRELSGNVQEHSGNVQGPFRERSGNVQEHSRNVLVTFGVHSEKIWATLSQQGPYGKVQSKFWAYSETSREHLGTIEGTLREHGGNVEGTFEEHLRNI